MSNVYNLEPPTKGKVILHTTLGDLDIELWPKEAPKAVRNFIQLCMEGYYDDSIFHRVIRDYMAQTGDPTGTGTGGESVYGALFKDEFHQRLKFNHRGLVACANQNQPHTNGSQFFITLDKCEWLDKKNTIFGKIVGDTIYNLTRFNDIDTNSETDRPYEPPKITSCEILANPFEDIIPRVHKPIKTKDDQEQPAKKQPAPSVGKGKNLALLSFGDQAEEDQQEEQASHVPKRIRAAHDVLSDSKLVRGEDTPADERIHVPTPIPGNSAKSQNDKVKSQANTERTREALDRMKAALAGKAGKHENDMVQDDDDHDDDDEDNDDGLRHMRNKTQSDSFAAHMLEGMKDKRAALDNREEGKLLSTRRQHRLKSEQPDSDADHSGDDRRDTVHGGGSSGVAVDVRARRAQELEVIKRGKRAYGKMTNGTIEASEEVDRFNAGQVADADLLKPWQASRERYKQRKQMTGSREKETLSRLAAFQSKLNAQSMQAPARPAPHPTPQDDNTKTQADRGYEGKIDDKLDHKTYMPAAWRVDDYLEGDYMDTSLEELVTHTLAFAKAPGHNERKPDDMDDYVVFDPLLEKNKGKFSKAAQKEKKRGNAWAGKSNN